MIQGCCITTRGIARCGLQKITFSRSLPTVLACLLLVGCLLRKLGLAKQVLPLMVEACQAMRGTKRPPVRIQPSAPRRTRPRSIQRRNGCARRTPLANVPAANKTPIVQVASVSAATAWTAATLHNVAPPMAASPIGVFPSANPRAFGQRQVVAKRALSGSNCR